MTGAELLVELLKLTPVELDHRVMTKGYHEYSDAEEIVVEEWYGEPVLMVTRK